MSGDGLEKNSQGLQDVAVTTVWLEFWWQRHALGIYTVVNCYIRQSQSWRVQHGSLATVVSSDKISQYEIVF